MSRERDVRNAIQANLLATGAFSGVWVSGLPENYGQGASDLTAAVVLPSSTGFTAGWDSGPAGQLDYTASVKVVVLARHPDPQLRDELAEQLLDYVANSVNGQVLVPGFTVPQKTMVTGWQWQPEKPPERRIAVTVNYAYLVTWQAFDTGQ